MYCSPPGFSVHGISQARILEWVAISYSRGSSWPREPKDGTRISCTGRQIPYHWPPGNPNNPIYPYIYICRCLTGIFLIISHYGKQDGIYFKKKTPKTRDRTAICMCSQSCPTLCDLVYCGLPVSPVHGDSPGENTAVGCLSLLQGIFPTQGLNLCLLSLWHWQVGSLWVAPPGKPGLKFMGCKESDTI